MIPKYISLFALTLALFSATVAEAVSVAVFPVEDLSRGRNSVNFELTDYLSRCLEEKEMKVIPKASVISFMIRNRVRRVGFLNTRNIMKVKKDLRADFILFATIIQYDESSLPALGLSLNLVRTGDAATVWSDSGGISRADLRHVLGLSEPQSTAELVPLLADNILDNWPEHLDGVDKLPSLIDIENVTLTPKHVRPGQDIICKVKLRSEQWENDPEGLPQVLIKVGNKVHMAMEYTGGQYYEASWTGSGAEEKNKVRLAMQSPDLRFYEGVWTEYERDDNYPVSLILSWPSGKEKVAFLGNYYVDSLPPNMTLKLKGIELDGKTIFRDKLLIIPNWVSREPIDHWEVSVENQEGSTVISQEEKKNVPSRFVWRGQNYSGKRVPDGPYLIVLKTWDRAGNMAITSQPVELKHTPPDIVMEAEDKGEEMRVNINTNDTVPISFWRVELRTASGEILKLTDGESLPADINIALPANHDATSAGGQLECIVVLRDILGNKVKKEVKDLVAFAKAQKEKAMGETSHETAAPDAWIAEF